ncbi:hypothetical protein WL00_25405 [Burkholderia cepacia]|nr:hypothetical protein WL00_25405 [Burkholderia cepacia]KVX71242.1 hypothetical protein WL07_18350 [Burkholderia cepacia]
MRRYGAHARPATPMRHGHAARQRTGDEPAHAACTCAAPPDAGQPPLAPAGAEAAPGMLAAPPGVPDGAVDGAGDMPPVALVSELAPVPVSLFFWQPAPAARPAIRMPAKTARDT